MATLAAASDTDRLQRVHVFFIRLWFGANPIANVFEAVPIANAFGAIPIAICRERFRSLIDCLVLFGAIPIAICRERFRPLIDSFIYVWSDSDRYLNRERFRSLIDSLFTYRFVIHAVSVAIYG